MTHQWMDRQQTDTDRWMVDRHRQVNGQTQVDEQTQRYVPQVDGQTDRWLDKQTEDGQTNRQMDTDGQTETYTCLDAVQRTPTS